MEKQITVYLNPAKHEILKNYCKENNIPISAFINNLIDKEIAKNENQLLNISHYFYDTSKTNKKIKIDRNAIGDIFIKNSDNWILGNPILMMRLLDVLFLFGISIKQGKSETKIKYDHYSIVANRKLNQNNEYETILSFPDEKVSYKYH